MQNRVSFFLVLRLIVAGTALLRPCGSAIGQEAARQTLIKPLSWSEIVVAASRDPALQPTIESLVKAARAEVAAGIMRRPYHFEDLGKNRTGLDKRTAAIADRQIRETFGLSSSVPRMCGALSKNLPTVAAATILTGDARLQQHVVDQLQEMASWTKLQRPGWSSHAGKPLPPDGNDGNWLATGLGIRAIATTLEIMGDRVDPGLRQRLLNLLEREAASIVDDWKTKRTWFARSGNAISNQWVLPTEGLIRACLVLGVDHHRQAYELGVANLVKALDAHGDQGVFEEGMSYAFMTLQSFFQCAHAMAVAGDRRAIDHPYLKRFPGWAVMHLQPGRMVVNCFDAHGSLAPRSDDKWRSFLSLTALCGDSKVANWELHDQFDGPSDDLIGLAYRVSSRQLAREPAPRWASYDRGTMVVWRDNWKDDGSGVWIRGGHKLDQHDHRDRGHVNYIRNGKPILIEAGTPDYGDPDISLFYSSDLGHNTVQLGTSEPQRGTKIKKGERFEGSQKWGCVAPIQVDRLGEAGGSVIVDGSACLPECRSWLRRVEWSKEGLAVRDQVRLPNDKTSVVRLRWHLGTDQAVEIATDGGRTLAKWSDATLSFEADQAFTIRHYSAPDVTMTGEGGHRHTCLEMQSIQPLSAFHCSMTVR